MLCRDLILNSSLSPAPYLPEVEAAICIFIKYLLAGYRAAWLHPAPGAVLLADKTPPDQHCVAAC